MNESAYTVPIYTNLKSQSSCTGIFSKIPKLPKNNELLATLNNSPENFEGGKIRHFLPEWQKLTSNKWVIDTICGSRIDFDFDPLEIPEPFPILFDKREQDFIDQEIKKLTSQHVIEIVQPCQGQFVSSIFLRPKKDGSFRLILNLKNLNQAVVYNHFKMDSLQSALNLVQKDFYMASCDLSQAYYACAVHEEHLKLLRFSWRGILYEFKCFVNGLAEAPRKFTKIMKVVFSTLRAQGFSNVSYIDDSFLIESTYQDCCDNIQSTVNVLDNVGFTVHPEKSVLFPSKTIEFLGFVIDSKTMTVQLTNGRIEDLIDSCEKLVRKQFCSIRMLARVIGKLVASKSGVPIAPLFYKTLENIKSEKLKRFKGNYEARIIISPEIKCYLNWWIINLRGWHSTIEPPKIDITIQSDSSDFAWGGVELENGRTCRGTWSIEEKQQHINVKELKAGFLCLKQLIGNQRDVTILLEMDNTTAVAYINNMGGRKPHLNEIAKEIWFWALENNIWLVAKHIPGESNIIADTQSRIIDRQPKVRDNIDCEWKLHEKVFSKIREKWPSIKIDLFASKINKQLPKYVSWRPDCKAYDIDAFTFTWDSDYFIFPPFSLIGSVLKKLAADRGKATLIAPLWTTQYWFPMVLGMLMDNPVLLPRKHKNILGLPQSPEVRHPLVKSLNLTAFRISGNPSDLKAFQSRLISLSQTPGDQELRNNIGHISSAGSHFVVKNKLVHIYRL